MASSTTLTKRYFEAQGYLIGLVERYNTHTRQRDDLFGIFDQVVVGYGPFPTLYVQTGIGGHAEHKRKILASPNFKAVICAGNGVALVTWRKLKTKRGSKSTYWAPRIEVLSLADIPRHG